MKGRTEHKESIWLWTIIVYSHLKEWLLLVPAAFCNPEENPRLGWEEGESQCTSFYPSVEIDWAKDKKSICNRNYVEAESAEAELSKAGCYSLQCWGTAVSLLVWALTHMTELSPHLHRQLCHAVWGVEHLSYSDCLMSAQSITVLHGFISLALNFADKNGKMNENIHPFPLWLYNFSPLPLAVPVYLKT